MSRTQGGSEETSNGHKKEGKRQRKASQKPPKTKRRERKTREGSGNDGPAQWGQKSIFRRDNTTRSILSTQPSKMTEVRRLLFEMQVQKKFHV